MNNSMINPSIVNLLQAVDNRYSLVVATSKRARQIIEGQSPLVQVDSTKPVTIAIHEIHEGAIEAVTITEGIK